MTSPKNKTILLVDDDTDVLESTRDVLANEGYEVITAKNGEEGIAIYKQSKPDIVFLDIKMPVMDGYNTFFKIKEYDPKAKIAFITAFDVDNEKLSKAREKTLLGCMKKPVSLENFQKLIAKYA